MTEQEDLIEDLTWIRQRIRNCRGAIESGQMTDKDVHGGLLRVMDRLDDIMARLAIPVPAQGARGAADIAAERQRQVSAECWTPAHDDEHGDHQLALAALCYLYAGIYDPGDFALRYWPWDKNWWKPSDNRRNLVRAGALIAAEIDRIDRASPLPSTKSGDGK